MTLRMVTRWQVRERIPLSAMILIRLSLDICVATGGAVTGASYELLKEGLDAFNTTPVEMDLNMCHLSISAAGKNRGTFYSAEVPF